MIIINSMKKLIGLVLLLTITGQCVFGRSVSIDTLKTVGANFLASVHITGIRSGADLSIAYTGMGTYNGTTVTALYVFSFNSGNGWIMVSADNNVKPVLAYSDRSVFDINNMAPATKNWIRSYENQITAVITNKITAIPAVAEEWNNLLTGTNRKTERITSSVTPLLNTFWNQSPFYNDSCPNTPGGRSVTGCVATAMAQVMKYWNWPSVGCGLGGALAGGG